SRLLKMPVPVDQRRGVTGRLFTASERALNGLDNTYRALLHRALGQRLSVIGLATALTVAAFMILPSIPTELVPQTDEGEVSVNARLASGTRVERAEQIAQKLEDLITANVPEKTDLITSVGG